MEPLECGLPGGQRLSWQATRPLGSMQVFEGRNPLQSMIVRSSQRLGAWRLSARPSYLSYGVDAITFVMTDILTEFPLLKVCHQLDCPYFLGACGLFSSSS